MEGETSPPVRLASATSISVRGRRNSDKRLDDELIIESKVLGTGMSGPVHMAHGKQDGRKYAVKTFKKAGMSKSKCDLFQKEVDIYLALDHPHIATLEMVYECEEEVHIVMEFMAGGELYDRLASRRHYSEADAADTAHQMLLAIAYLHDNNVAHRDLKLENYLYEAQDSDHLELIDFGFAKVWDHGTVMSESCGTVHYVAPEVLRKSYTPQADLWSIGVIVYMLLTGSSPWRGDDRSVLKQVSAGEPRYGVTFGRLSPLAQEFVRRLLVKDPAKRLSAVDAINHPFLVGRDCSDAPLDAEILSGLRSFAHAAHFKRACLAMMAWSLNAEDRIALREKFLCLDTTKTGMITHDQLRQSLMDTFHIDCAEAERLFAGVDVNNNDVIDYSEFLAAVALDRVRMHEDVLRRTFSRFDRDASGKITVGNLRDVLGDAFEGELVEDLISEADTNKDGSVDYCEFLQYIQRPEKSEQHEHGHEHVPEHGSRKHKHLEITSKVVDCFLSEHSREDAATSHGRKARTLRRKGSVT